jgi:hypothetical protein
MCRSCAAPNAPPPRLPLALAVGIALLALAALVVSTPCLASLRVRTAPINQPTAAATNSVRLDDMAVVLDQITGGADGRSADVQGCDLGIMFDFGPDLYLVFGDTFGLGSTKTRAVDWRSNTMVAGKIVNGVNGYQEVLPGKVGGRWDHTPCIRARIHAYAYALAYTHTHTRTGTRMHTF